MGKGGQKSETSKQAPTRKTKAPVDRRQNNRMLRQCPSGIAQRPPHHAIAVPTAMQNSHKDNVRSSAVGKQLKQKNSPSLSLCLQPSITLLLTSSGPAFFVRVQLVSLLFVSPGCYADMKVDVSRSWQQRFSRLTPDPCSPVHSSSCPVLSNVIQIPRDKKRVKVEDRMDFYGRGLSMSRGRNIVNKAGKPLTSLR